MGEYNVVDRDYSRTSQYRPSRQIRTRRTSHDNILSVYDRVRLEMLKYELAHQKTLAVTDNYYVTSKDNWDEKTEKRARKIAELEKNIKVLLREDVPKNYVDDRAIKLKESMMSNLRSYVGLMYMIGFGKESEIFDNIPESTGKEVVEQIANEASEEIGEIPTNVIEEVTEDNQDEYVVIKPTNYNSKDVKDRVKDSFKKAKKTLSKPDNALSSDDIQNAINREFVNVENYVDSFDVKEAIDRAFGRTKSNEEAIGQTDGAVYIDDFVMPYDDELSTVIDEDLIPYDDKLSKVVDETKLDSNISGKFNKAIRNCVISPEGDVLSQEEKNSIVNEFRKAFSHYDNELKKTVTDPQYNYKPMNAEEIAAARKEIGEYGSTSKVGAFVPVHKIKNASSYDVRVSQPALRDEIIVVPDRNVYSYANIGDKVEEYQITSVESADVPQFVSRNISSYDSSKLQSLRAKVEELQKAQEISRKNAIDAEERLQIADKKSRELINDYKLKSARLAGYLEAYAKQLAENINKFDNRAKLATEVAEMEDRFNEKQHMDIADLDKELAAVPGFSL